MLKKGKKKEAIVQYSSCYFFFKKTFNLPGQVEYVPLDSAILFYFLGIRQSMLMLLHHVWVEQTHIVGLIAELKSFWNVFGKDE